MRCPFCQSRSPAIVDRRTSKAGIFLACGIGCVLLVLTLPTCGLAFVFMPVCVLPMIWCVETRSKCRDCNRWQD